MSAQCGVGCLSIPPRDATTITLRLGKARKHQIIDEIRFIAFSGYPNTALQNQRFSPKYIQIAQTRAPQKSCLPNQQCPGHYFSPSKREASAERHGSHTIFLLLLRLGPRSSNNKLPFKIFHQDPALSLYKLLFHYFICLTNTSPGQAVQWGLRRGWSEAGT